MRFYKLLFMAIGALVVANSLDAQGSTSRVPPIPTEPAATDRMQILAQQVAEIRRDQLNYQIERDLLKEAYASNLQTVQLVLTMILGAFTILGYFGLRSIGVLRSDFQKELDTFRTAKTEVDIHLRAVTEAQSRADAQMATLAQVNAAQDRRLRGLELREKAASLAAAADYSLALEYVVLGLEIAPDDVAMLDIKANCLSKMGRPADALLVHEQVLKITPNSPATILNLMEMYLLTGRNAEYDALSVKHAGILASRSPLLAWYFRAIRLVVAQDITGLLAHLDALPQLSDDNTKKLNWVFDDARVALAARPELAGRGVFFTALKVLDGKETRAKLAAQTESLRQKKLNTVK